MDTSGYSWLLPFSIIITGFISIAICSTSTRLVLNYVNKGTPIEFYGIVMQILNLINMSYLFIFNTQGITRWKGKITGNVNNFLLQAPVLKKDIYNTKFVIFQIASTPFLVVVIYFIGLNIFVSSGELISAYSGFIVLIYCIWTITISISLGFSSLTSKKYNPFRYLVAVLMLTSLVFLFYLMPISFGKTATIVNKQNMYSGLGPIFIPVLKACSHIGGFSGLIIILISTLSSYFFGCKLPMVISQKEVF